MENFKKIFERMDIQQVRAFLVNGEETCEIYDTAYDERIENGERTVTDIEADAFSRVLGISLDALFGK